MTSTFTPNLGIQKPGTGDQAGSWGNTVNTNSDILDRGVNGVVTLTLSGTSSTLTTEQGTLSNGQYKALYLAGSPSGTHTITIDPNTAQKSYFVANTTAQSVIFTQGSGGNVTIPSGCTAILQSNGAGSTATVSSLTNTLSMSAVKITGGTITGITDLAVADGGTGASTLTGYVQGNGTAALTASATIPSTAITGLGTMAAQAASAVAITGGTITGITDLAVADGGTGASTGAGAIANFGLTASVAELNYVNGVTSAIQTQLNTKAPTANPTFTGTVTTPSITLGGSTAVTAVASQAQAEAGTSNTTLMTPLRTAQAIADTVSTTYVLAKVALASPTTSVGAYAFMTSTLDSLNTGDTTSGGNLDYCLIYNASGSFGGLEIGASGNPTGTWKLMSGSFVGGDRNNGLFLRVS